MSKFGAKDSHIFFSRKSILVLSHLYTLRFGLKFKQKHIFEHLSAHIDEYFFNDINLISQPFCNVSFLLLHVN